MSGVGAGNGAWCEVTKRVQRGGGVLQRIARDAPTSAPARAVATDIVDHLAKSPHVASVTSAWTAPPAAATALISKGGTPGFFVAGSSRDETNSSRSAQLFSP